MRIGTNYSSAISALAESGWQTTKERMLVYEAQRWIGITEIGGPNCGQMVELFQKAVDGKAQGEPWCVAFVQFCADAVDGLFDAGGQASDLATHSKLYRTEHVLTLWNKSKQLQTNEPRPGTLCIWQIYEDDVPTTSGHIGIVVAVNSDGTVTTVEGNTSPGEGVWLKQRRYINSADQQMRFKGFLKVWE